MSEEKFEGKPILSPNYTQIPNVFFDYWMSILSPGEFKVLMCIARKTFGWHKSYDTISLKQIAKLTGLSKMGITKIVHHLEEINLINCIRSQGEYGDNPNQYEINVVEGEQIAYEDSKKRGGSKLSLPPPCKLSLLPPPNFNRKNSQDTYYLKKDYTKEKKERGSPPSADADSPTRSDFSSKEKTIERAKDVATTEEEHQKLIELYGDELTDEAYEVLSLWKQDTPKSKWKKSDYRSIRRWTIDAVKEKRLKEGTSDKKKEEQPELISTNQKWIKERLKGISFDDPSFSIDIRDMCVYFKKGQRMLPVGYAEPKFKEIVENQLRSLGKE